MVIEKGITNLHLHQLQPYIHPAIKVFIKEGLPAAHFKKDTPGLRANAYYFGQKKWAEGWLKFVHCSPLLRQRWQAVTGSWNDKVVVDIGCGPGNLQKNIGDTPKVLIGVDVSAGTLKYAVKSGYIPLLADAHAIPLKDGIADVVALNAAIHHCDDMEEVIKEAARLVKKGGFLIADHDPQKSAYNFKFLGKLLWAMRMPLYRLLKRGGHRADDNEQEWAKATEIHHTPGDGLTAEMFTGILENFSFSVKLYPHNHDVGTEILNGAIGKAPLKIRITQWLSGINPNSDAAALSLLCVAQKL